MPAIGAHTPTHLLIELRPGVEDASLEASAPWAFEPERPIAIVGLRALCFHAIMPRHATDPD